VAVKRIWHGWTTLDNADAYRSVLNEIVFPSIEAKRIPGYIGIELLVRFHETEVEFITLMTFDSLQNVIDFQGPDYEASYVPDAAQAVLKRWDQTAAHYEVVETREYP